MATLARHFLQPTAMSPVLADRQQITTTTPSGAVNTGTSVQYAATGTGVRQFRPGTANLTTVATVPSANAVPTNKWGWRQQTDTTPEKVRTVAGNWSVSARFTVSGATTGPQGTLTFVAYLVSGGVDTTYTEIGRSPAIDTGLAWAGGVISGNIAANAVTGPLNSRVEVHVYLNITTAAVSTGATTYAISTNSADSFLGPGTYTVLAERSGTVSTTPTVLLARGVTAGRVGTVSTTPTVTNRKDIAPVPKGVTTLPTTAVRKAITVSAPKAVTTAPTVSTRRALSLIAKTVTTAPTAAMAKRVTANRSAAVTTSPTPSFARAIISARSFSTNASGTPRTRLDLPQEVLNRIIPAATPDWPLNPPTKAITGVTRDTTGAVIGGATVRLIRQVDDVKVATVTSDPVTGVYGFARGTDDPYAYYVIAFKDGVPEVHGVSDRGLVPA